MSWLRQKIGLSSQKLGIYVLWSLVLTWGLYPIPSRLFQGVLCESFQDQPQPDDFQDHCHPNTIELSPDLDRLFLYGSLIACLFYFAYVLWFLKDSNRKRILHLGFLCTPFVLIILLGFITGVDVQSWTLGGLILGPFLTWERAHE